MKGAGDLLTRRQGRAVAVTLIAAVGFWLAVGVYDYAARLQWVGSDASSSAPTLSDALLGRGTSFFFGLRLGAVACILGAGGALALHEARRIRPLARTEEATTQRLSAEEDLRKQKELMEGILEHMPMGAFAKDPNDGYRYILWNRQMEAFDGCSRAEVLGRTDYDIYDRERADSYRRIDDQCLRDGKVVDICEGLAHDHGLNRVGHRVEFPVKDDAGDSLIVFGLVKDITEQRRLEEQLHQAQKMEALGLLAGGVAHDFNNVLQVINGYAELLHRDTVGDTQDQRYAKGILDSVRRSMTLVRQLLSFTRICASTSSARQVDSAARSVSTPVATATSRHVALARSYHASSSAVLPPIGFFLLVGHTRSAFGADIRRAASSRASRPSPICAGPGRAYGVCTV